MFEAKLDNVSILKKVIESIKDLVTEVNFDVGNEGITLQAMDSAHVSLVSLILKREGFKHYCCDQDIPLGINLNSMSKIIKCAGNNDSVMIKAEENDDTINLIFESQETDVLSDFKLKLMDIDSEILAIPEQDYDAVITMSSAKFQKICRDMSVLGDTVKVDVLKETIEFSVSGDLGSGSTLLRQNDEQETNISSEQSVSLSFALRYLNFFTKATTLSPTVILRLSYDVPLVVEYSLEELGSLRFYLAPKIDDEE